MRITRMRRKEEASQIRFLAYYYLVQTYLGQKKLSEGIRTANRFVMEVEEDYDEPIMRAILVEKAKGYFMMVEQMRQGKRPKKEIDDALKP